MLMAPAPKAPESFSQPDPLIVGSNKPVIGKDLHILGKTLHLDTKGRRNGDGSHPNA